MGHPLPTGQLPASGELAWFLVAVPDNRQFIQAALAAYSKLGSFWVWGAEGPAAPQSNDAADLFNEAINATLEAWEQNMLQQLIDAVDQVEPKLDALIACCDPAGGAFQIPSVPPPATVGNITIWPIGNSDTMPPDVADIVSPVGGVSSSYPAIPDYDSSGTIGETEFFDYRCAGATFVLDTIINLLRWSAKAKRLVGDVADILSDLAFHIAGHFASGTPLGNILTILDMTGAATWPTLLNAATATNLETAANQVEAVKNTIRQELACGASAAGALTILQAALQNTITDAAALAFLTGGGTLGFLVSMLWTATLDTGWSAACNCGYVAGVFVHVLAGTPVNFVDGEQLRLGKQYELQSGIATGVSGQPYSAALDLVDSVGIRITAGNMNASLLSYTGTWTLESGQNTHNWHYGNGTYEPITIIPSLPYTSNALKSINRWYFTSDANPGVVVYTLANNP